METQDGLTLICVCTNDNCENNKTPYSMHKGYLNVQYSVFSTRLTCNLCQNKVLPSLIKITNSIFEIRAKTNRTRTSSEFDLKISNVKITNVLPLNIDINRFSFIYLKLMPLNQDTSQNQDPDENFYKSCREYLGLINQNNEMIIEEEEEVIDEVKTQITIESLNKLGKLSLDIGSKSIFIQHLQNVIEIHYKSLPSSIYLSQESHKIMEIFNISPNLQRFFYKGKRIYEVSSLMEISSKDDPIYLMQQLVTEVSIFYVQLEKQNVETFEVPIASKKCQNIFDVLLEFRNIYDVKDIFRNEVDLYGSDDQILQFESPVPEDFIIKIVPNFNIEPRNYVMIYKDIRNTFSFNLYFELEKLKYQSAIFFKLNPKTIEFYHENTHIKESINDFNCYYNQNIDIVTKSENDENLELKKVKVYNIFDCNIDEDITNGLNMLGSCEYCRLENKSFLLGFGGFDILNLKKYCFQCEGPVKFNNLILLNCFTRLTFSTFDSPEIKCTDYKIEKNICGYNFSDYKEIFLEVDEL